MGGRAILKYNFKRHTEKINMVTKGKGEEREISSLGLTDTYYCI